MTAWYNENDEHAAGWLENLISERLIAPGIVDRRSIRDVRASELADFTQCHFFAGIGGWSYALRLAGWDDARPVWTGSCPCQPFSLAGARRGFDDDRHLWPVWHALIRERRPAKIFGEQVASASEWLRLVRGDLEALGYAVGAIPVEAASAGADHLRDRYWFVADSDHARSQGRIVLPERASERAAGPDGLADADGAAIRHEPGRRDGAHGSGARLDQHDSESDVADGDQLGAREGRQQRSGQQRGIGGDQEACAVGDRNGGGSQARDDDPSARHGRSASADGEFAWAIGADGKARRVKPGIRLLAHGVPNRVGLLRGFGNAIDPRPAAEFIRACS